MTKSIYALSKEAKEKHQTTKNTYEVKIITLGQDFNFFYGETGRITKNTGEYLGLKKEIFDVQRN